MKRLLSLSALLLCSVLSFAFEVDGIAYNSKNLTVEVTGKNPKYSGDIVIPEKVEYEGKEYSVTSIGYEAFEGCSGLTSVTIPNSVTSIGSRAFNGCSGLTSVTIPNSVTSIGDYAFEGCTGLTSVTIGSSVTNIEERAFSRCKGLTSIDIPNSVTSIGDSAFEGCSGLTSVTIGNSVTTIGEAAFMNCRGLTEVHISDLEAYCKISYGSNYFQYNPMGAEVPYSQPLVYAHHLYLNGQEVKDLVIPDGVVSIGKYAFCCCKNLTSVTIPNSVTSIGEGAFGDCLSLTSVTIGNSVTSIGRCAFADCFGLTSVTIPNSVTSIGDDAFYCSGLTSVTIGNSVTSIGDRAFMSCSGLTSVTIPESVTSIGNCAFFCSGLTSVHITDLAAWCNISFEQGNSLLENAHIYFNGEEVKDLVIPDGVTTIGNYAFEYCSSLTSVTIPNSVTSIGDHAFDGCTGLTSVTIPNSVTSIGDRAFDGCCSLTSVTIPNSVTSIGDYAFAGCSGLPSVTIPNSVTSIGERAFYECTGLTSVTIPNSVTSIGYSAFQGCSCLTEVHITDLAAWYNISFGNLYANPLLYAHHLFLNGEVVKDLVIPDGVTSIGSYAFEGCSDLTSVTIPNSVTSIGNNAFYGCSGLTSLTIPNSVTSIGNYAFYKCSGLTEVVSLIEEPFDIDTYVWNLVNTDEIPLYVPAGTKEKYEATEGWNVFTNIIEMGIAPSGGEDINYGGGEISGETNLNGNVVGNIYYNIGDENGEYSSAEGCITLRTPVSDEQMSQVEGMDLFGEDMKNNFTGIIFMVQAGSGTIKVNAETTGNMVLKVKVGSSKPMEFTLSGKLDAKLPYEVSEPTYVYIYGGSSSAAGAKGVRKAAGDGEVKIYGISWTSGTNGIEDIKNEKLKMKYSSVYNLNGQRVESLQKGINIVNGKKVMVK